MKPKLIACFSRCVPPQVVFGVLWVVFAKPHFTATPAELASFIEFSRFWELEFVWEIDVA